MSIAEENKLTVSELRRAQQSVERRLDRLRRQLRLHLAVEGLFWVGTTIFAAAALSLALDRLIRFEPPTRWALLVIALAAIIYVAWRKLIQPLLLPLSDLDLAELLDARSPGVAQQITNVLELPKLLETGDGASPSMVRAAVLECLQALDRRDLTSVLNVERRRLLLAACGAWLGLAIGFAVLWPATASLWARRWLAGSHLRWPQHTYLNVVGLADDGTLLVPRGELAVVQIDAGPQFTEDFAGTWQLAGRGRTLVVESDAAPESTPPASVGVSYVLADGSTRRGNAAQFDSAHFRYELAPLADPAEMEISGGDDWLGPITIEPIDRPGVRSIEIEATLPGGAAPEKLKVGEGSQLLYLPQTQLKLTLVANQPLASADALDKGLPLSGWQRVDASTYTLAWTMKETLALEFRLVGQRGRLVSKPYFLAVGLLKDREPRLTIRASGVGRRVTPVARIPLSIRANDDFALAALALDWELTTLADEKTTTENRQEELQKIAADASSGPLTELNYDNELSLKDRKLSPGSTIKLRGTATDACTLGAQTGQSRWLAFQVVTADELFYDILMRQREQRAKFAQALESAKSQSKTLSQLARPDDVPGLARAQQVINRQVSQVAAQLDATLVEMTLNDLGNPAARDNLQSTIITPMQKLHEDVLSKLRAAIDGVVQEAKVAEDRRTAALALSDQSIEIMQSILAQMSLWESFVDVINQLKHVIDGQTGVLKATEEAEKSVTDKLFDDEPGQGSDKAPEAAPETGPRPAGDEKKQEIFNQPAGSNAKSIEPPE